MQPNENEQEQDMFTEIFRSHCSAGLYLTVASTPDPRTVLYAIIHRATGAPRVMGNAPRRETVEQTVLTILEILMQVQPEAVHALHAEAN